MKVGVILIGGSLKGIYGHTGVVSALRELKIHPTVLLGASAGSVIASFYATGLSEEEMYHKMITLKPVEFLDPFNRWQLFTEFVFNKAKHFTGFVKGDKLQDYVRKALKNKDDFSKCEIPLHIAATNLRTRELTLFNTGSISEKCRASTAIPMLFCPKEVEGQKYIDGALAKEQLPKALTEVHPELDYIIVSNFSYENQANPNTTLEETRLPIFEIVRNILAIHERRSWPTRVGKTRVLYLKPGVRTPVDLFDPNPALAKSVFDETKRFTMYHLSRSLQVMKKRHERGL